MKRLFDRCPNRIRTYINCTKNSCPAIRRSGNLTPPSKSDRKINTFFSYHQVFFCFYLRFLKISL